MPVQAMLKRPAWITCLILKHLQLNWIKQSLIFRRHHLWAQNSQTRQISTAMLISFLSQQ